jgi:hypothetical protein
MIFYELKVHLYNLLDLLIFARYSEHRVHLIERYKYVGRMKHLRKTF